MPEPSKRGRVAGGAPPPADPPAGVTAGGDGAGPGRRERVEAKVESAVGAAIDQTVESLGAVVDRAADRVPVTVRPKLRGWLHAGAVPVVAAAVAVLVAVAPAGADRLACAVYAFTAVLLFSVSAAYHRGRWSPRTKLALKRFDHANIFLIIAGTYTPFAVMLLPSRACTVLLVVVWAGALAGVTFRVAWPGAPRWLVVPAYVALGWVAVWYMPAMLRTGGVAVVVLMCAGGLLYTLGGIVYGTKRPDPDPAWFGFHEVFHALVLAAFFCLYAAVLIVALGAG